MIAPQTFFAAAPKNGRPLYGFTAASDPLVERSTLGGSGVTETGEGRPDAPRDESSGVGRGVGQRESIEQVTALARRIWQAYSRHKWTTSRVRLPEWEAMELAHREAMMSLATAALGLEKQS